MQSTTGASSLPEHKNGVNNLEIIFDSMLFVTLKNVVTEIALWEKSTFRKNITDEKKN